MVGGRPGVHEAKVEIPKILPKDAEHPKERLVFTIPNTLSSGMPYQYGVYEPPAGGAATEASDNIGQSPIAPPSPRSGGGAYHVTKDGGTLVWNNHPRPGDEASWSGDCDANGYATGAGTLTWSKRGAVISRYTGKMIRGKLDGPVTNIDADGKRFHGTFVNGSKSADWSRD